MQFVNPNILYALFALLIPILVHLFQLRRFEKTKFTNVKFLKELIIQTRKSSQIKKWLILTCRMLAFTALIFAFAQPYFASKDQLKKEKETVIYLDNSLSMQAKGTRGELLRVNVQQLLENFPKDQRITLFTNNKTFRNTTLNDLREILINLEYTPNQISYKALSLKSNQLFKKNNSSKELICISDFQSISDIDTAFFSNDITTTLIQTKPAHSKNISIDTAYFNEGNLSNTRLNLVIKNQNTELELIPVSLYANDSLINKVAVPLNKKLNPIAFDINHEDHQKLKLVINDGFLHFDNTLFLSQNKPKKLNVLAIGDSDENKFLKRIFTTDEFNFVQQEAQQIDYGLFNKQQLVLLNEIDELSAALINNIKSFSDKGGIVVVIPSNTLNSANYNSLISVFGNKNETETRLTKINTTHPIYKGVFEKKVNNFQYPKVNSYYPLNKVESVLLALENRLPFLAKKGNYYIFSATLNSENSNFKQSPIIVPTLYNIAKSSYKTSQLYYDVGTTNTIDLDLELNKDEVITLIQGNDKFIPLQQIKHDKVTLTTNEQPIMNGWYEIDYPNKRENQHLAYNYSTKESDLNYHAIDLLNNSHINSSESLENSITTIISANEVHALWKWFVIFALLFLLIETLILKFYK